MHVILEYCASLIFMHVDSCHIMHFPNFCATLDSPPAGCTNQFVKVEYDSATSTISCVFLNNRNIIEQSCSIKYGKCNQKLVLTASDNSTLESPNRVTLQVESDGSDCYVIRASNGTFTVIIEGQFSSGKLWSTCSTILSD